MNTSRPTTLLVLLVLILSIADVVAQQMLILKKGKVLARFNQGDEVYFELKDQRQIHHTTIQSIRDFYFTTVGNDTIQYSRVAFFQFRNDEGKIRGKTMAVIGVALLGVYGLNSLAFDEVSPSMRGLRLVGGLGTAIGMTLYLTSTKKIKLKGFKRLKYIPYDSPLYR